MLSAAVVAVAVAVVVLLALLPRLPLVPARAELARLDQQRLLVLAALRLLSQRPLQDQVVGRSCRVALQHR